jgi:FkbM family methyltransferase
MNWRTHPIVLGARDVARALKLTNMIAAIVRYRGYETKYDQLFSDNLRKGDCVWDVGANVGYYSTMFADRVGPSGSVHSFEPSPPNFARLSEAIADRPNVHARQLGLGNASGTLPFQQGSDTLGATSRIVEYASDASLLVPVERGEDLIVRQLAPPPNAIKIDVEGFESEVFDGLGSLLSSPSLHLIGVEVHFRLLKERGRPEAAAEIERRLSTNGFQVSWPDFSHIVAIRR